MDLPHNGFLMHRLSDVFVASLNKISIKTNELLVIRDAVTLMWRHCYEISSSMVATKPFYWQPPSRASHGKIVTMSVLLMVATASERVFFCNSEMLVSVVPESRDNEYVTITHILCQKIYILLILNPELNVFPSYKFYQCKIYATAEPFIWTNLT